MKLTDDHYEFVELKLPNGEFFTAHINMAFDQVLRAFELFEDTYMDMVTKVCTLWDMFIVNYDEEEKVTLEQQEEVILHIFHEYFQPKQANAPPQKKVYDMDQDAEYIYASFLQDYNIDLFDMHGVLHWDKFLALLNSLSDKTKFKQVINIRTQKIPRPNKHNKEEIDRIRALKKEYALNEEKSIHSADDKMDAVADTLTNANKRKKKVNRRG